MSNHDIIVVGGGASGMMAAGRAAELGAKVLLLEKMKFPGLKLGITGKGRCNITNTASIDDFVEKIQPNGEFLRYILNEFPPERLISFFNSIGVSTIIERGGRVYPENIKAVEFARHIKAWCQRNNVEIQTYFKVNEIIVQNNKILGVKGIDNNNEHHSYFAPKVIIATGGKSYPSTGSTGDAYEMAKKLGHTVTALFPALVPLLTDDRIAIQLNGLELRNIKCTLIINHQIVQEEFGEVHFRDNTIAGPLIIAMSRKIVQALINKQEVSVKLNLKPALSKIKLENRIIRETENNRKDNLRNVMNRLLPMKLIHVCLEQTRVAKNKPAYLITKEEIDDLVNWLSGFILPIKNYRSFDEAIITAGGVDTKEIDQQTLESKLISGLYFTGEVIDVDAPTGGYNLQIAFSTGWIAGRSAAE